jgi:periplasmic protein CpxP/Spy
MRAQINNPFLKQEGARKTMRTLLARYAALAVFLIGGALALAQGPGGAMVLAQSPGGDMGHGPVVIQRRGPFESAIGQMGRWWNNPRMIDQLKLTDDQRKTMDGIWYQHREKLIDLQANLQRAELAMEPLMSADQPDQAALEAQIDKIVSARGELERANAHFLLDIRMKLTPDQWKSLKDMRNRMGQRMMDRRNKGGPSGPGQGMWRQRRGGQNGAPQTPNGPEGQTPQSGQPPAPESNPPQQ